MISIYFNSQPHEEADGIFENRITKHCNFNSQPHEEADESRGGHPVRTSGISTHSLTKRLTMQSGSCSSQKCSISTHSLTKRLTAQPVLDSSNEVNFNSQPHEEADELTRKQRILYKISTHSLTKRLTSAFAALVGNGGISTHSLTKRLTAVAYRFLCYFCVFQLTASRRG